MSRDDPLSLPATPARLRAAAAQAGLDDRALARAIAIATATPIVPDWQQFVARTLALLGAALGLAGAVCFVAYNWEALGRFAKMGLVAAAIAAAAIAAWRTLPRLIGQIALAVAAVLVGPMLGVYGQTYQTGADPYELFLGWLLLIIPWVIAARFAALWVFAAALLDLTVGLYWAQVLAPDTDTWLALPVVIALAHAALIAGWEKQVASREPWFAEPWAPHALALVGWIGIVIPLSVAIVIPSQVGASGPFAMLVGLGAFAATWHWHRRVRPDRFMIAAAVVSGLALAAVLAGKIIFDGMGMQEGGVLLMALVIIGEIALGLRWYRGPSAPESADPDEPVRIIVRRPAPERPTEG